MTVEQLAFWTKIAAVVIIGFSVTYSIVRFIILAYRGHKNRNAPVFTERATAHYKHPEMSIPYMGRGYSYVRYITFHTDFGQAVKLYMNQEDFFLIPEGAVGQLTWQGEKFWKFIPEKREE